MNQDSEESSVLVVSDLTSCPRITLPSGKETILPNLLAIYDDLVDTWLTDLPPKVPGPARVAKHKIIRQVAVELCLSSIGISLQQKETGEASGRHEDEGTDMRDDDTIRHSSPPVLYSPEMTPTSFPEPHLSLPSPARTPSVYSHATNTTGSELGENPAISRLRQYAVSVKSQLDPGKSKLLDSWVPGGDPAQYSWEKAQKEDESGEEDDRKRRREEARRRRRTEKFLSRERARAPVAAESQPAFFMPSGSQPDVAHQGLSSQTVDELPMTQPDRGAFGSRTAQKGKKKQKRRKSGF